MKTLETVENIPTRKILTSLEINIWSVPFSHIEWTRVHEIQRYEVSLDIQ